MVDEPQGLHATTPIPAPANAPTANAPRTIANAGDGFTDAAISRSGVMMGSAFEVSSFQTQSRVDALDSRRSQLPTEEA